MSGFFDWPRWQIVYSTCNWQQVLEDMAYLLGDEVQGAPHLRTAVGQIQLAKHLGFNRSTVRSWMEGRKPHGAESMQVIDAWMKLTGKSPLFLPTSPEVLSASKLREKA